MSFPTCDENPDYDEDPTRYFRQTDTLSKVICRSDDGHKRGKIHVYCRCPRLYVHQAVIIEDKRHTRGNNPQKDDGDPTLQRDMINPVAYVFVKGKRKQKGGPDKDAIGGDEKVGHLDTY